MLLLVLILCLVLVVGGVPTWGYHAYGWGPSGVGLVLVVVLLVVLLSGRW